MESFPQTTGVDVGGEDIEEEEEEEVTEVVDIEGGRAATSSVGSETAMGGSSVTGSAMGCQKWLSGFCVEVRFYG